VALADRLTEILDGLPHGWELARVEATVDQEEADRAATILAPATPGRSGATFRFEVGSGTASGGVPARLAGRVLDRLDEDGIRARLALVSHEAGRPAAERTVEEPRSLAAEWDRLAAKLPRDWSDLLCEVQLDSTDHIEVGALRLGPVNPSLVDGASTFRFRSAHWFGYGAAPQMTRRCLERLDEEGITGHLRILRVLSDSRPVATQGPVWRIGGRAV
jgi:hypothetical protein